MPTEPASPVPASSNAPGAASIARLAATRPWRRFTTAVADDRGGWVRLADRLADPAALDAWVAVELAGTAKGHRDLAGSLVVYRLAGSLAELIMVPLLAEQRVLTLTPERLWLSFSDDARIEAVGLPAPTVALLPGDSDAGRPGTVTVDGTDGLYRVAAQGLVDSFAGVAAAVRERAPFGLAGIWGTLADHVGDVALRWARDTGGDADRAWAATDAVVEDLAARPGVHLRARPQRHDVSGPSRTAAFVTRGTCCLVYKRHEPVPGEPDGKHDRIAAAACTSCPLLSEEDREARLLRYLS